MIIGGLVSGNENWQKARQSRPARITAAGRNRAADAPEQPQQLNRRSSDIASPTADDRRGIAPAVRSKSTQIIYDARAVDRRETADRRRRAATTEPVSEFVAQTVAREGMLLDLRPDPVEARRARATYGDTDDEATSVNRIDLIV